jgi:hypothetical protein
MTDTTNHAEVIRNFLLWAKDDAGYGGPGDARVASEDAPKALDALAALTGELEAQKALTERLKLEAQIQAGEARAHIAIVQECYQIATGGTGEPATWNGAEPIRKAFTAQAERIKALEEALAFLQKVMDESRVKRTPEVYRERDAARAEVESLKATLKWIANCTDSEMGDGDGARDMARAALGGE